MYDCALVGEEVDYTGFSSRVTAYLWVDRLR